MQTAKELTFRSIVLGVVLSVVMGAANVYMGLKAGITVSASIPAAVMAILLFRTFSSKRGGSQLLEANQVQTAASAGESLAAGIIFTMPALVMVGFWTEFDFITVWLVALSGGLLGILFMIPMRRVFVVNNKELPYPEGVACAAVLRSGTARTGDSSEAPSSGDGARLVAGALLGAGFKLLASYLGVIRGSLEGAVNAGGRILYFGSELSPMLVAVGMIVRLNVAILIFIGGAAAWLIGLPLLSADAAPADPLEAAWGLWSTQVRYVGVGAMVVGGISSIFQVRHGLGQAARSIIRPEGGPDEEDLPRGAIIALIGLSAAIVLWLYQGFTHSITVAVVALVAMLIMAFFFSAVASYIVGLVGNSNSPVSGMTISTVLFTGGLLYLLQVRNEQAMVATLGVAAVVCCVACTSGDVCNDLKTGSLLGAVPKRQQMMQILGVVVASLVMAPVLQLLHSTTPGGIGGKELPAPQAGLFASLAKALSGQGELPAGLLLIGAGLGILVLLVDKWLQRHGSNFRAHLMPIAVGMYLPLMLAPPILIGGLVAHLAESGGKDRQSRETAQHRGMLFSSGAIAGESLIGIGLAGAVGVGIAKPELGLSGTVLLALSLAFAGFTVAAFWRQQRAGR